MDFFKKIRKKDIDRLIAQSERLLWCPECGRLMTRNYFVNGTEPISSISHFCDEHGVFIQYGMGLIKFK